MLRSKMLVLLLAISLLFAACAPATEAPASATNSPTETLTPTPTETLTPSPTVVVTATTTPSYPIVSNECGEKYESDRAGFGGSILYIPAQAGMYVGEIDKYVAYATLIKKSRLEQGIDFVWLYWFAEYDEPIWSGTGDGWYFTFDPNDVRLEVYRTAGHRSIAWSDETLITPEGPVIGEGVSIYENIWVQRMSTGDLYFPQGKDIGPARYCPQ